MSWNSPFLPFYLVNLASIFLIAHNFLLIAHKLPLIAHKLLLGAHKLPLTAHVLASPEKLQMIATTLVEVKYLARWLRWWTIVYSRKLVNTYLWIHLIKVHFLLLKKHFPQFMFGLIKKHMLIGGFLRENHYKDILKKPLQRNVLRYSCLCNEYYCIIKSMLYTI